MHKLVAIYKQPEDTSTFDEHYFHVHAPLAKKMPGLKKIEVTRFTGTPMGDNAPYYLQADLYFSDRSSLDAAMGSKEGRSAAKDVMGFAGKLVTMMVGEVVTEEDLV
ncbi:EthD family reductase [Mechercharimyces sp. CAU 1602]|uniref:EthD family reductase n=1 Tax=Mechercharimyces sp. CAU 1602 TaxID=2973933 RepID=UPI0021625AA6|nr:EthD family reductase [Mechercharimyces sp. CAU 1602]MCS1351725.1 EthD family reductase [Mechercharimyces sp. CAU 1602]